jgi:negative regulator of flagellin synthesis FlgM
MKIGSPDSKAAVAPLPTDRKANGQDAKSTAAASATTASASVELSATASQLRSSSSEGSFDADKVARIAQAIRDGQFKINPDKIADKLISNAQELLSRSAS